MSSVSECQVPAGELVRLVQLYAGSWQEKGTILSKLHDSYVSKKSQLDIALRKLALSESKVILSQFHQFNSDQS